jgi:hypothetical protein
MFANCTIESGRSSVTTRLWCQSHGHSDRRLAEEGNGGIGNSGGKRDVQVDEAGFTDVSRDELGGELYGVEEKGEVSCGCWAQAYLIC